MDGTTTLQIPMRKTLKAEAEAVAFDYGFSSLQEAVRVFLTQLTTRRIGVGFAENDIILSKKAETRYAKALSDLKENKNFVRVSSTKALLESLHGN